VKRILTRIATRMIRMTTTKRKKKRRRKHPGEDRRRESFRLTAATRTRARMTTLICWR